MDLKIQSNLNSVGNQERKNLDKLYLFVEDLKVYNNQYSMGAMMAEAIIGSIGEPEKKKISFKQVDGKTKETQRLLGLNIEPVKVRNIVMMSSESPNETANPRELRVNIESAQKFNALLKSFKEKDLQTLDIESLKFIAESLIKQIHTEYDLESLEEDRLFNLFAGLDELIKNYKQLDTKNENGLGKSVEQLEKYLSASRGSYMKEYLLAEAVNVLPKELGNDGFGPSSWQGDSTPEHFLNYYWGDRAFKTLDFLKTNPNAKELYDTVLNHLKKCIDFAKKSCEQSIEKYTQKGDESTVEHFKELYKVIPKVESKLQEY